MGGLEGGDDKGTRDTARERRANGKEKNGNMNMERKTRGEMKETDAQISQTGKILRGKQENETGKQRKEERRKDRNRRTRWEDQKKPVTETGKE